MGNNRVRGLDGRDYPWNLTGYAVRQNDARERSSYHLACRKLLGEMYPTVIVCEEVPLPGSGNLRFDFYLPLLSLAIEVQGEQHYRFTRRFHSGRSAFLEACQRDADKAEWCRINGIRLATLRYDQQGCWAIQIADAQAEDGGIRPEAG